MIRHYCDVCGVELKHVLDQGGRSVLTQGENDRTLKIRIDVSHGGQQVDICTPCLIQAIANHNPQEETAPPSSLYGECKCDEPIRDVRLTKSGWVEEYGKCIICKKPLPALSSRS